MTLPPWSDWKSWSMIVGFLGTLLGIVVALPKAGATVEPFFYVSSGYLKEATQPLLVVSLQNTLAIIEGEQQTIKTRMQMALTRLAAVPADPVALDALNAAQKDMDTAEFRKREAWCDLRAAQGLGCSR